MKKIWILPVVLLFMLLPASHRPSYSQSMSDYCYVPPFAGTNVPPNVMIMLSIETPMQGAAHPDVNCIGDPRTSYNCSPASCRYVAGGRNISNCYSNGVEYYGYFDPRKCYTYDSTNRFFYPTSTTSNRQCSGAWSGNFLNWATMMAVDAFRRAMTGGNRIVDTISETRILGARQLLDAGHGWFPIKRIDNAQLYTPYTGTVYLIRYSNGFVVCRDTNNDNNPDCNVGQDIPTGGEGANPTCSGGGCITPAPSAFRLEVKVCNPSAPGGLEPYCNPANNKPEGVLQRYADRVRFGLISYAMTGNPDVNRDGGVVRSNVKWISRKVPFGIRYHDSDGNLVTCNNPTGCDNPEYEIEADGRLRINPDGISGTSYSGVIGYINKFGYASGYKSYDPISEMYYEIIRYFKGLGPSTNNYCTGLDTADDGAPVLCSQNPWSTSNRRGWRDPYIYACQRSFVLAINDANPWCDKRVPGTAFTGPYNCPNPQCGCPNDYGTPSNADTSINASYWTDLVGQYEGITPGNMRIACVLGGVCDWNSSNPKYVTQLSRAIGTPTWSPKANSYYIAGLSYYARNTDLRSDLQGTQNLITYMIDTQESNPNMLVGRYNMLYLAAKFGGYEDQNNNGRPDLNLTTEWDRDNDGFPDNYFFASDPAKIEESLIRAFSDILRRASSGATVATLASRTNVSSVVLQPYFFPRYVRPDGVEISWIGFLRSFWLDTRQNLREDTNKDKILQMAGATFDRIFQLVFDSSSSQTRGMLLSSSDPESSCSLQTSVGINQLVPVFDAGCELARVNPSDRRIYYNKNGNLADFITSEASSIRPIWQALESSVSDDTRASCIIRYVRGENVSSVSSCNPVLWLVSRVREFDSGTLNSICPVPGNFTTQATWKLGDIIYSTPSVVSAEPLNLYHLRYNDSTYLGYITQSSYRNRSSFVFISANDGMLHAFRLGQIRERRVCSNDQNRECQTASDCLAGGFCIPDIDRPVRLANSPTDNTTSLIGREEWAFIPRNALPYLVWYGRADYCHIPTVDYRTVVFDASISGQPSDTKTASSWRTVLVGTMGPGGRAITVGGNTYSSSIFALDLTDWLNGVSDRRPTLRWEVTLSDSTLTLSFPAILKLGNPNNNGDWYVVVGTGPGEALDKPNVGGREAYSASTSLYFINLRTGAIDKTITLNLPSGVRAAVGDIKVVDVDNDYQDDVIYFGVYGRDSSGNSWGGFYRLTLRNGNTYKSVNSLGIGDISEAVGLGTFSTGSHRPPVFGAPTFTRDENGRLWVFFGTGKYISSADRIIPYNNYFIGFKDDCWNGTCNTAYTKSEFTNTTGSSVTSIVSQTRNMCICDATTCQYRPVVYETSTTTVTTEVNRGWYYELTGEAIYSEPIIFGSIVDALTFVPPADACQAEGSAGIIALHYKTGRPNSRPAILSPEAVAGTIQVGQTVTIHSRINVGRGVPPVGAPFQVSTPPGQSRQYEKFVQLSSGVVLKLSQQIASESQGRFLLWIEK